MPAAALNASGGPSNRARLLLWFVLGWVLLGMMLPGPASAHAVLEGGSVFDGQVLQVPPEELFLDFNEPVDAPAGGVRVFNGAGQRVDVGGTFVNGDSPDLVRVSLQPDLADGTYAVTYRITSADGHPVNGAFVFSVGAEAADGDALLGQVFSADADRPWAITAAVARWVMYGGSLLLVGAVMTIAWLRRPLWEDGRPAARAISIAAVALLVATVLGLALQDILVIGNGVASLGDTAGLVEVLGSFVGAAAIVRVLGGGIVLLALRRGRPLGGGATMAGASLVVASLLLEGHTLTTQPATVIWPAATVHILTGAVWFGGLAVMAIELRGRRRAEDPVEAGRLVARFSSLFTVSVIAVVVAGSALSWVEVRALRALTSTAYGWTLVAKLVAVAPLLVLGAYNNRRLVPVLTGQRRRSRARTAQRPVIAGGSDELGERAAQRDAAWSHLGRTVRIELVIVGVVLAVTSVLVALQPAAEAAGVTGAFSTNQAFEGVGQLSITVDPNRAGRNEVHIYLLSDVGRPVDVAEEVTMSLSQPELDIGPIVREPIFAGPGHYILAGPELSVAGRWEITTEVALNRFDVVSTTTEVVVNP